MQKERFYAVWNGKKVGIFKYWAKNSENPDCPEDASSNEYAKNSVHEFPNAKHQSFKTFDEAKEKLETELIKQGLKEPLNYFVHDFNKVVRALF
jgi:viroplasmin and RNaseH domain-containing protein